MPSFTLTLSAKQDLREIGRYTRKRWSIAQGDKYLRRLNKQFEMLAENPGLGGSLKEIRNDLRQFHCMKHYIFYVKKPDKIVVVAVLHERMDAIERVKDRF